MSDSQAPRAIGVILDGNRRWAKANNLPQLEGHRAGMAKVKELANWAYDAGVKELILYAFSTENWNRAKEEVAYLMDLFETAFHEWAAEVAERGVRIRFIGERDRLPEKLLQNVERIEQETKEKTEGVLTVALSYGGRAEILAAVNSLLAQRREQVGEEEFKNAMWSAGLADPDLIIRTGGDKRLSNFLPWQSVYSEFFFIQTPLPGLTREEFLAILAEFAERERRHGK